MGVLNVTPDSFSDGGRYVDPEKAITHGIRLANEGADVIDIGGESTRPGSRPVSAAEEMARVLPVVRGLRRALSLPLSIDTYKSQVARAALEEWADMVNDISALRFDPDMVALVVAKRVPVVLMHMQGTPRSMQERPCYTNVLEEVKEFLLGRVRFALESGANEAQIMIDPGIGFGKGLEHNLALMRGLPTFASIGKPLLVGPSRKTFIGKLLDALPEERLEGSLAAAVAAALAGANMVRMHDVRQARQAIRVADALRHGADKEF